MKAFLVPILLAASLGFSGCESDMPPSPQAENPLQRGLRGEGHLVQPDHSDDPIIRETTRESTRETTHGSPREPSPTGR